MIRRGLRPPVDCRRPMSYCRAAKGHPFHGPYHDREYGFPVRSDAALFERLALEINQAGLSWLTMLQKREGFRRAFEGFDPEIVARYGERKYEQLLRDPGIIRNRLKIRAVIENARRILAIRESHGSLREVARRPSPPVGESLAEAVQGDVRLHRRRDREVVSAVDGVPEGRAHAGVSGVREGGREETAVDEELSAVILSEAKDPELDTRLSRTSLGSFVATLVRMTVDATMAERRTTSSLGSPSASHHLIGPNAFTCSSMTLRSPTTTIVALSSFRYF